MFIDVTYTYRVCVCKYLQQMYLCVCIYTHVHVVSGVNILPLLFNCTSLWIVCLG